MSACNNCGSNKNQYTDYGSYLRTRGNNVDINKFIYDIGYGKFKFNNLTAVDSSINSNTTNTLPSVIVLNENGEMKTVSKPLAGAGTYTLKLIIESGGNHTFSWAQ